MLHSCITQHLTFKLPNITSFKWQKRRNLRVCCISSGMDDAAVCIPAAPIFLPDGPWKQIPGGVTAAKGFKAAGMYAGLRTGQKPDLALVTCDVDAKSAGSFTTNLVAAAPVLYCKKALETSKTARAVLINAGQAMLQRVMPDMKMIKKDALLNSLAHMVNLLSPSTKGADSAAVAITTTDLVSKSVAIESEVGGNTVRVGGMAKGSGMIHPNMATMLGVVTTDADVTTDIWRKMVQVAVNRSFNQITVDGDTSTNDTVIALATCLDAVMQGLAKSIAWDGEGATCLIEVTVSGASCEADAAKIARSVASSSLTKAAVYGRDPNWGRIACAAGYAGVQFHPNDLRISLGDTLLMDRGQPLQFDRDLASNYLRSAGEVHGTVVIQYLLVSSRAWNWTGLGCDLSYDYVKINAEYTT
ncbi:unnamed protein product [Rhodiola kirilowii]